MEKKREEREEEREREEGEKEGRERESHRLQLFHSRIVCMKINSSYPAASN